MPTPERTSKIYSADFDPPRVHRASPYHTPARIATQRRPSSGCTSFSVGPSALLSSSHGAVSRHSRSSLRKPHENIVSQSVTPQTSRFQSNRQFTQTPSFRPQILHAPSPIPPLRDDPMEDVFSQNSSTTPVIPPNSLFVQDDVSGAEPSITDAEHPEDVAICEEILKTKSQIFDPYYLVLLSYHHPPPSLVACPECSKVFEILIKCHDCFGGLLCCRDCMLKHHQRLPFHSMSKWDSSEGCWLHVTLNELGLQVRAVHVDGSKCDNPGSAVKMEIMHLNGLHTVSIRKCTCTVESGSYRTLKAAQCLANRLYPATSCFPEQAYTFDTLTLFDISNLKAFTNINQFCEVMHLMTGEGSEPSGTLRSNFHTATRQWRLFKQMQEWEVLSYDEFLNIGAVEECPVCPHPNINLPPNWQDRENGELLNSTFIMGDGNFHMQLRSGATPLSKDPSYFCDSGFFAKQQLYRQYTQAAANMVHNHQKETQCISQAGTPSRDRPSMKLSVSGIWALSCKHGWFRKNGVADIPKGERYYIVDVVVLYHLNGIWEKGLLRVVFTYDVNCKYKIYLMLRSAQNPFSPVHHAFQDRLSYENRFVAFLVNAWHQLSHNADCADNHGIRNTPNVGMTSGEDVESPWALINYRQYSLREMGAGARRDALTAHLIHWNSEKKKKLAIRLEEKYWHAKKKCDQRCKEFGDLEAVLNQYDSTLIPLYRQDFMRRGGEQFRPNADKVKYPSRRETLHALREQEKEDIGRSKWQSGSAQPVVLLVEVGMQLEIDSLKLGDKIKDDPRSTYLLRKKEKLDEQIEKHQHDVYESFSNCLDESNRLQQREIAHASSFASSSFSHNAFSNFGEIELRARVGHGHDILEKIRKAIGLQTFLWRWHRTEVRGLVDSQRVSSSRARGKERLSKLTRHYRSNWQRILKLSAMLKLDLSIQSIKLDYLKGLQQLEDVDLRLLSDWIDDQKDYKPNRSEGMPWIWKTGRYDAGRNSASEKSVIQEWEEEARRLEWLHAFQSSERWKEEVLLLNEELRRLGAWYSYKIRELQDKVPEVECNENSYQGRARHALRRNHLWIMKNDAKKLPKICQFKAI